MASEQELREQICDIGRRIYAKGFAAGNDGNITCRLDEQRVLCTPTLINKGFMKPDDLCVVDRQGKQLSGTRPRTSEIFLHLEVMRGDPNAVSVVHCHPPYATAFGIAREPIPSGILPEVEVFLGIVPSADYATPGDQAFAETIRPYIGRANTVVLSNHGTVSWGKTVEWAYWHTEIVDAYCRMLLLAKLIGNVSRLTAQQVEQLLDLKERFGLGRDVRRTHGGDLLVNPEFGKPSAP